MVEHLVTALTDPAALYGHFTNFLLIVSMLMRRMILLRSFAVAAGVAKVINRAFFAIDPVSVMWESIFVIVNVGQLLIIWYYERHHRFDVDEQHFVESMPKGVERRALRQLLRLATVREFLPDEKLTVEGQPVADLLYIANGVARIERAGKIIAVCGPGDYLGEMSFLTGGPATATVVAARPIRALAFEQTRLRALLAADANIRRAMEAGLNRNLVGKLVRSNTVTPDIPAIPV